MLLMVAALLVSTPGTAQSQATTGVGQHAALDALIAKRGFGSTYEWNDYTRLHSLTERGSELLKSGNFDAAVQALADEQHLPPQRLRTAFQNFLSFALTDRPRAPRTSYAELLKSAQALGDPELGAQMTAVALSKIKESNCVRGDMARILDAFDLSTTQGWTIVEQLICESARQDFLDHFPDASRAIALRSFGYGGASRSESAAFHEWRVRPENLALIVGDDRAEVVDEWRREHIASLLEFGLANEAARFYRSLDLVDRKRIYAIRDGLYWADIGGLRERDFRFFRFFQTVEAALAFRFAGQSDVADDIAKHGIGDRAERNWTCLVEQIHSQCGDRSTHFARVLLLMMRYVTDRQAADPYYLVEAVVSSNSSGRLDQGTNYGIPHAYCALLADARYRSICVGAKPLGAWAREPTSPFGADAKRLNAAILRRHPDILSTKPKYDEAQRVQAKLALAAPPIVAAVRSNIERIDERLVAAFRASRPYLANLKREEIERNIVINRAGDRAFFVSGDWRSGSTYRAIRSANGSWTVTEISNWIAD